MIQECENCREYEVKTNSYSYSIIEGTRGFVKYINENGKLQISLCEKCYKELLDLTGKIKAKDTSMIPEGPYCYTGLSYDKGVYHTKVCPYFDHIIASDSQSDGYCHYIEEGDSNLDGSDNLDGCGLLWDQCKSCGVNDEID